jgi:hypothetical protein
MVVKHVALWLFIAAPAHALVGASDDTNDSAVVDVVVRPGNPSLITCSGVVVSTHVILTSHACFNGNDPSTVSVSPAPQPITVKEIHFDPDYQNSKLGVHDVVALVTNQALPQTPLALHRDAPTAALTSGRIVGFGVSDPKDDAGVTAKKRTLPVLIDALHDDNIEFHSASGATCYGDSGGPLVLDSGEVAAIYSYGQGTDCPAGAHEFATRIDAALGFLDPILKADAPQAMPRTMTSGGCDASRSHDRSAGVAFTLFCMIIVGAVRRALAARK